MPTIEIALPILHPGQLAAFHTVDVEGKRPRFLAVRCGRRWGKTDFGKTIACDRAIKGQSVFWAAPDYKIMSEAYNEIADTLLPVKRSSSKMEGVIRTITGGRIDFWTLDNERAGRSRKYHLAIIDEAAFTKPNMKEIWEKAIMPTLLDYRGSVIVFSNTNGIDQDNFFWRICNEDKLPADERHGFVEFHAPSSQNPYLPADELERLRRETHPLVFAQEYLADFVDWSGVAFFSLDKMLVDGEPVEAPARCDGVFCVIDTAVKDGSLNDGTAAVYFARSRHVGHPLIILGWDLIQIEGALLETWLPTVLENCEAFAKSCGARLGSLGAFIEDKSSGEILLQQARRRGLPATPIDTRLTALGKDARALSVSGYFYRGMIKLSREAYDKVSTFKGATRNHLVSQVTSFRIGDKDAARRADDLLDCATYGASLALGDNEGF